jgi:hypothetical protein
VGANTSAGAATHTEEHAEARDATSTSGKPSLKFHCINDISQAIVLFQGKAHILHVDAIAHAANEKLDFNDSESAELLESFC